MRRLLLVRGLRAFGDGFTSLLLPLYLTGLHMTPLRVGIIATATLFGSGLLTLLVGLHAYRFKYRNLLLTATVLMIGTGAGFALFTQFWPLLIVAFVGTLNPSGGDVSVFLPLEHAVLSRVVIQSKRTAAFANYALVGTLVAAVGALAAAFPDQLSAWFQISVTSAQQLMFGLYGVLGLLSALIYRDLPMNIEMQTHANAPLRESKKRVFTLAALFSIDAFGGGFIVQSIMALWLYQQYDLAGATAGLIFFWTGIGSALSYLVAVRIANRIGLIKTMVFTHLPSSILLMLTPFMPNLGCAIALLLARSVLSQMDVPTRSSYVMSVVPEAERAAAASVTLVPRSLAAASSPAIAGYLLGISVFGWPLVVAGGLKIVYDLLLLGMFSAVRPPEEAEKA